MRPDTIPSHIDLAILGGGRSGLGAALLARKKGLVPFVSEAGSLDAQVAGELGNHDIFYETGGHSEEILLKTSEVIKSPGIPDDAPVVQKIREAGIPVIGEIEFAARYTRAKIIAITGTNGKTTTTMLTHHLLQHAGFNVGLGGNVGKSFAMEVAREEHDYYVLEVSSFQLDNMYDFKADVGILLNITPDHLKRYGGNILNYTRSKFRILQNMKTNDGFIYFQDDRNIARYLQNLEEEKGPVDPVKLPITLKVEAGTNRNQYGAFIYPDQIYFSVPDHNQEDFKLNTADLPLDGKHNMINTAAGVLCSKWFGVKNETILEGLKTFKNVPHRLEWVRELEGITFYNDSKATNVEAVYYALEAMGELIQKTGHAETTRGIIWIAGGEDKGNDYALLYPLVEKYVKEVVCVGKDNTPLLQAFESKINNIKATGNMEEAVNIAYNNASRGDIILLSPACASFDLFDNYEHRGDVFKNIVNHLLGDGIKRNLKV